MCRTTGFFLQSAPPAAVQKRLRALEVVVRRNGCPGDFASVNGLAVERGDDADMSLFTRVNSSCAALMRETPPWPT